MLKLSLFFYLFRKFTLRYLLVRYFRKKRDIIVEQLNEVRRYLVSLFLTSYHMDSEEIWLLANVFFQCRERCLYFIKHFWGFSVCLWYPVVLESSTFSILCTGASLDSVLFFIGTVINGSEHVRVDCPHSLLVLKTHINFYLRTFKKIKKWRLGLRLSVMFDRSISFVRPKFNYSIIT